MTYIILLLVSKIYSYATVCVDVCYACVSLFVILYTVSTIISDCLRHFMELYRLSNKMTGLRRTWLVPYKQLVRCVQHVTECKRLTVNIHKSWLQNIWSGVEYNFTLIHTLFKLKVFSSSLWLPYLIGGMFSFVCKGKQIIIHSEWCTSLSSVAITSCRMRYRGLLVSLLWWSLWPTSWKTLLDKCRTCSTSVCVVFVCMRCVVCGCVCVRMLVCACVCVWNVVAR